MGRFLKLNRDIQDLADSILSNQDLCKLIHYADINILEKPSVNAGDIINKRLLLFSSKNLALETGTYITIRPYRFKSSSNGGHYITTQICFDIYTHREIRNITFKNKHGEVESGDRVLFIMDLIDEFMMDARLSIGRDNLDGGVELENRNAEFGGYTLAYNDVDFRKSGRG